MGGYSSLFVNPVQSESHGVLHMIACLTRPSLAKLVWSCEVVTVTKKVGRA